MIMKKNLKTYIAFFLILVVSTITFIYLFQISEKEYIFSDIKEATDYIIPQENTREMGQKFKANDLMCGIRIRFTDVNNTKYINGSFTLGVKDLQSNKILKEIKINKNKIQYYNPFKLTFDTIKEASLGEYYVYIRFDDVKENNIGIGYSDNGDSQGFKMVVDGKDTQYNLNFSPIYKRTIRTLLFFALLIGIFLTIAVVYFVITKFNMKLNNSFLLVITIFLLLGTFIIPLNAGHDEIQHFYKAYDIARGNIFPHSEKSESTGQNIIAASFPKAIYSTCANNDFWRTNYIATVNALKQNIDNNDTFQYDNTSITSSYFPAVYIPSVAGILVSKLFTGNVGIIYYSARLSSALFSILILFLIMRILPFGKKIFFVICLNPMVLTQLCVVTADTFTILMSFLFIAFVLNLTYSTDEFIKPSHMILLVALSVCIALSKAVYLPICFTVFVIPKDKFKNKKNYYSFMLVFIIVTLFSSFAWLSVAKSFLLAVSSLPQDQIDYISKNLLNAVGAGLVSIKNESWNYLLNMFGNKITWTDKVDCGFLVSFTMMFLTIATALCNNSIKERLKKSQKYILGVISLLTALLIFVSVYVQWSPYAWTYINGVQGRYFLPILPLALILLGSVKIKYDNQERIIKMIYFLGLFPFAYAMISTVIAYL